MTACFIFELRSEVESQKVQQQLSEVWTRSINCYFVDVFLDDKKGTLICILDYYFPDDLDGKNRIKKVLDYLFEITVDGHVYYYRFDEATYLYWKSKQKISLDMLFGEFAPTLGGNCLRYEILRS